MRIRSKLLINTFIAAIVFLAMIVASYFLASGSLQDASFRQLVSIREVKSRQIESYISQITKQVVTFSHDLMITEAMEEFTRAFYELENRVTDTRALEEFYLQDFSEDLPEQVLRANDLATLVPTGGASAYLQNQYIATNPHPRGAKDTLENANDGTLYSSVHEKYHRILREYQRTFGYYDLFLLDAREGNIVYSVYKETDYATSMRTGPYAGTGIAKAYHEALSLPQGQTFYMADFEPYLPSYGAPAAFVSAPIRAGNQIIGVLIFQFPVDEINRAMTSEENWQEDGLGSTGETFLVGWDSVMRSQSRVMSQRPQELLDYLRDQAKVHESTLNLMGEYGQTLGLLPINTVGLNQAIAGKTGSGIYSGYAGKEVLGAFKPLELPGLDWMILAEMESAEAFAPVSQLALWLLGLSVGGILLVSLWGWYLMRAILGPVSMTHKAMEDLARGEGDLSRMLPVRGNDELSKLTLTINGFLAKMREIVQVVSSSVAHGSQIGQDLSATAEETSSAVTQISSTINSMGRSVTGLGQYIDGAREKTESIESLAKGTLERVSQQDASVAQSSQSLEAMVVAVEHMAKLTEEKESASSTLLESSRMGREQALEAVQMVEKISGASNQILEAIDLITGIASQTNLLAMNAAIEAAHAGEAGKGFAVVADEIRALAESSTVNSANISQYLQEIVDLIEGTRKAVEDSGESFDSLDKGLDDFLGAFRQIGVSVKDLKQRSGSIRDLFQSLRDGSRASLDRAKEIGQSSQEIQKAMVQIQGVFKEIEVGISEVSLGTTEITQASSAVADAGLENRKALDDISREMGRFKT